MSKIDLRELFKRSLLPANTNEPATTTTPVVVAKPKPPKPPRPPLPPANRALRPRRRS